MYLEQPPELQAVSVGGATTSQVGEWTVALTTLGGLERTVVREKQEFLAANGATCLSHFPGGLYVFAKGDVRYASDVFMCSQHQT